MTYPTDPGGRFASDYHRRVLGHLSTSSDRYGWSSPALFSRMAPDVGTEFQAVEDIDSILAELEKEGFAHRVSVNGTDLWQMTDQGFDVLTGSIANEPPPGAAVQGPAAINAPGVAAAMNLDGSQGPANPQGSEPMPPAGGDAGEPQILTSQDVAQADPSQGQSTSPSGDQV